MRGSFAVLVTLLDWSDVSAQERFLCSVGDFVRLVRCECTREVPFAVMVTVRLVRCVCTREVPLQWW